MSQFIGKKFSGLLSKFLWYYLVLYAWGVSRRTLDRLYLSSRKLTGASVLRNKYLFRSFSIKFCYSQTMYIRKADMWTHPHWASATRISKLSPAWKFKLHFTRITDVSPAFCNFQVKKYPPPSKKKDTKKQKQSFI